MDEIHRKLRDECLIRRTELEEVLKRATLYVGDVETYRAKILEQISYYQYSYQEVLMHRGFYCPSLVLDIFIGNSNRGKIFNKCKKSYTYKYGFDEKGRLIYAVRQSSIQDQEEFLIYEKGMCIGIAYCMWGVNFISMCKYHDNILESYHYNIVFEDKLSGEYTEELYHYEKDGLKQARVIKCFGKGFLMREEVLIFQHDKKGYLSTYTIKHNSYPPPKVVWGNLKMPDEPRMYKVYVKRKV